MLLFQTVFHVVGSEPTVLTVFDDGLSSDMNVEVTFVTRVNTQLLTSQGEFALLTLIDHHRTRTRTRDENAGSKIFDLQRRWNALKKDFTLLKIVNGHVFATDLGGIQPDQFVVFIGDRHTVRRDDDIRSGCLRHRVLFFDIWRLRLSLGEVDAMGRRERTIAKRVQLGAQFHHIG